MGLRINTNIAAVNAQRNLSRSQLDLERSLDRLSSGLRITRAGSTPTPRIRCRPVSSISEMRVQIFVVPTSKPTKSGFSVAINVTYALLLTAPSSAPASVHPYHFR